MARLRKLGEEMKPSPPAATPAPATTKKPDLPSAAAGKHEQNERDKLDKELEMHNATMAVDGEDTEDLKAKLERLKAEVCTMQPYCTLID